MAEPARRLATYEDLLAAPEHLIAEIIHGRLVTHPRPVRKHARAASRLGGILMTRYDQGIGSPGGWYILDEPEIHFGPRERWDITVPDIAGWRIERKPGPEETVYFTTVPDWTCEFISPSSEKGDRQRKPGIYASFGVQYYWLGDPLKRTLETFALDRGILKLTGTFRDDDRVAASPFGEVPFSLGALWED